MKNYFKVVILLVILFIAAVAAFIFLTPSNPSDVKSSGEQVVLLNEITKCAEENWGSVSGLSDRFPGEDFVVLDINNSCLFDSRNGDDVTVVTVEEAIKMKYPYSVIVVNSKAVGYVVLIDDVSEVFDSIRLRMVVGMSIAGLLIIIGVAIYGYYVNKNIVAPFRRMQAFAGKVAEGNLSEPLMIEKDNMFGAFSESFDIMREELDASRKREIALQVKEKELVASLSHDLKTPVTGIKLTAELLKARLEMDNDHSDMAGKLDNIYRKADEIDSLVTDLFTSTLDDLGEFKVVTDSEPSSVLSDLIRKYDDRELVTESAVPGVLILIDKKRMGQVIGNIINNSYKYANTAIDVDYELTEGFLEMSIRDHGPGVPEDELELITNKFYRGKEQASSVSEGSGLGLYIARILMEKMGGELIPSVNGGFCIRLVIPLA